MDSLKGNNFEVYKLFFEGNVVIWRAKIEAGQDRQAIYLVIKHVIMTQKKNQGAGFSKNSEKNMTSFFAQLLTDVYPGISEWWKNFTR